MLLSTSQSLLSNNSANNELYCPSLFDNLCWPQTRANHLITISCSSLAMPGVDESKFVTRDCLSTGEWSSVSYESCIYPDIWDSVKKFYMIRVVQLRKPYTDIFQAVRIIELMGLSVSFISILVSFIIFFNLKNRSHYYNHTKIHFNLLLTILIQVIARIINYGIQVKKSKSSSQIESIQCSVDESIHIHETSSILKNMCPLILIFSQLSITSMFMWMLSEAIYLNNVITFRPYYKSSTTSYFYILGWFVPFCITLGWSMIMFIKQHGKKHKCWENYQHLKYFRMIDGPRYVVMIINFIVLLNVIRNLFLKTRYGSEIQIRDAEYRRSSMNTKFVRKAIKPAIFLSFLLSITHILNIFVSPDHQSLPLVALYCLVTNFLMAFQGFFGSLFYCFLNTEIKLCSC